MLVSPRSLQLFYVLMFLNQIIAVIHNNDPILQVIDDYFESSIRSNNPIKNYLSNSQIVALTFFCVISPLVNIGQLYDVAIATEITYCSMLITSLDKKVRPVQVTIFE